jgi:Tol biopolymer transport system component
LLVALLGLLVLAACNESPASPTVQPTAEEAVSPTDPVVPPLAARTSVPGQAGGRLLFVRGGNIWVWADGQATQLTTDGGYRQPRWSPSGDGMLYIRLGASYADLWQADSAGQNARQLTANKAQGAVPESLEYVQNSFLVSGPSWARTANGGDLMVYSSDKDGGTFHLYLRRVQAGKVTTEPVYGAQNLTGHIDGAAISPSGGAVAFTDELTDPKTGTHTTQIFIVDTGTGTYRALTSEANGAYDPAWSPDGNWLVYSARQDKGDTNLIAIRADGTGRQRLTDSGKDRGATWSPDGAQIAFVRQQGNGFGLFFIDLDTSSGTINPSKPQRLGDFADVDPASGVSWAVAAP